jgi:hypothetical protein
MNRKFMYTIAAREIGVSAEQEGDTRHMVRMSCAGSLANVRIGYPGAGRTWLAEFFVARPSVPCKSAKQAYEILAKAALTSSPENTHLSAWATPQLARDQTDFGETSFDRPAVPASGTVREPSDASLSRTFYDE